MNNNEDCPLGVLLTGAGLFLLVIGYCVSALIVAVI